jgi:hypothetical protein
MSYIDSGAILAKICPIWGHFVLNLSLASSPKRIRSGRGVLPGIDLRTVRGRRFRALLNSYTAELDDDPTEADLALARQAAALTLQLEDEQLSTARGAPVDSSKLILLTKELTRLTDALRGRGAPKRARGRTHG